MQRPLDVLGSAENKHVIIYMKNRSEVSGIMRAFDSHINVWLDKSQYKFWDINNKQQDITLGKTMIRGDNIILISPVQ